jgi:nitrate reductase delta subunit
MRRSFRHDTLPDDVRPVWAACSALLDYPTQELLDSLDAIEGLVPGNEALCGVIAHLRSRELRLLQEEYVQTFDHTRKCALYLTYFSYGDTRRRGVAMVQFKQAYRRAGVEFDPQEDDELPDHLCVVLQFGAEVDAEGAWRLLNDHRAGVEMLRLALAAWDDGAGSPWLGVLQAVCGTLPELKGDEADAIRRLIEEGPPAEEVGLQGYGTDPMTNPTSSSPLISSPQIPVGAPR